MSDNCQTRNPLKRDGTSQPQRLLKTMLPSYVGVDERSMKDLAAFAQKFSAEVQYYDADNNPLAGNQWESFFQFVNDAYNKKEWAKFSLENLLEELKVDQQTAPHIALFFGFLYQFKVAQDDLNTITKRHLDFYYRDVLKFSENPAVPDQVALIFTLAKQVDDYLVKKGTQLKAGKDDTGVELIYKVDEDTIVNKSTISSLKAVYANINNSFQDEVPNPNNDFRVYASPIANSADGLGEKIETEEKSWRTFGAPEFSTVDGVETPDREEATLGFAIASPQLFLAEGERVVTLKINYFSASVNIPLSQDSFKVYFSGEKEWLEGTVENIAPTASYNVINGVQTLRVTLSADQDPIMAYNIEELEEPYTTSWPVMKVVLNNAKTTQPFVLKALHQKRINTIELKVRAKGLTDLILQSGQGILDGDKPFQPFGNRPYLGSHFYIGSWEAFQKRLSKLAINYKWNNLPGDQTFGTYYANYNDGSRSNRSFLARVNALDKKTWVPLNGPVSGANNWYLLRDSDAVPLANSDLLPADGLETKMEPTITDLEPVPSPLLDRDETLERFTEFNLQSQRGFLRLTLSGKDFGHGAFPNSYAEKAIALAKHTTGTAPVLPNAAYTPTFEEFSLDYTAIETLEFGTADADPVDQFFHLEAFGVREIDRTQSGLNLLPAFKEEGNLYIGITGLKPPQTLSMLFQIAEGSANPDKGKQPVVWSYLADDVWLPFDVGSTKRVLRDTTNGLLTSGILAFSMPSEMTADNSLLPAGEYWIKATVAEDSDAICKLIDVRAQAVLVSFADQGNDPEFLRDALADGTISKLVSSASSVSKIEQPYASFGGRVKEDSADFYIRVSERLRHKNRAITIWDYERLVLQNFPEVYKAKCLNHTCYDVDNPCKVGTVTTNYSEMAPGHVTVIAIPDVKNKNAVDPLRPKVSLSTLEEIKAALLKICPPCIHVHVKNPVYEEIKVKFKVRFAEGYDDIGYYSNKLNQDIKEFLAPWAYDCSDDIAFGGRIHKSMILNFVEERSYVDYVTCFEMYHIVPSVLQSDVDPNKDVDEAIATAGISILGSADDHIVNAIEAGASDQCDCDDNEVIPTEEIASTDDCACDGSPKVIEPDVAVEISRAKAMPFAGRRKTPNLF